MNCAESCPVLAVADEALNGLEWLGGDVAILRRRLALAVAECAAKCGEVTHRRVCCPQDGEERRK